MISPGDTVIAAVSGGPDSMCLLEILEKLRKKLNFDLEAAHFEHGIRGQDSLLDAAFVSKTAAEKGLKLNEAFADVPESAGHGKMSLEEAAREHRYEFFEKLAEKHGDGVKIALGHNSDDQAETVLMRLLRGSGMRGLAAIPPVRGHYIRPLIEIRRLEIIQYLESRDIAWREDETNAATDALRNHIRHILLPLLVKEYNPNIVETLGRTSDACRATVDYIDKIASDIREKNSVRKPNGLFAPRNVFENNHPAVAAAVFESMYIALTGGLRKLRFQHRLDTVNAAREGRSGIYTLPDGWIAAVDSGGVFITTKPPEMNIEYDIPLVVPGKTYIEPTGVEIDAEVVDRANNEKWANAHPTEAYLDMDALRTPIIVRNSAPGDRMRPLGGSGSKKLQDIFTDAKAPRWKRPVYPVIVSGDDIAWVAPFSVSELFKVTEKTEKLLHFTVSGIK